MRLYSLRRGFLQRVHGRRLSPLSARVQSLRPESLFERRENETSSWNPSRRYSRLCFDLGPSDRRIAHLCKAPRLRVFGLAYDGFGSDSVIRRYRLNVRFAGADKGWAIYE